MKLISVVVWLCMAVLLAGASVADAAQKQSRHKAHKKPAPHAKAPAGQGFGANLDEPQSLRALETEISRKLGSQMRETDYPEEARREGWSGTTMVNVVVGSNGRIKETSVHSTSGFPVLDEQALRMVDRVNLWWIPHRFRHREVSVKVPVGFYIRDAEPAAPPATPAESAPAQPSASRTGFPPSI